MPSIERSFPETSLPAAVGGKLGLKQVMSDHDLADRVERQLPAGAVQALVRNGFTDAEVFELVNPRRTLAHRKAKGQRLSRDESDKAVRIARAATLAERVFGDRDKAWRWLRKEKRQFGGAAPVAMLATEAGARLVEELLVRIDEGLAA